MKALLFVLALVAVPALAVEPVEWSPVAPTVEIEQTEPVKACYLWSCRCVSRPGCPVDYAPEPISDDVPDEPPKGLKWDDMINPTA